MKSVIFSIVVLFFVAAGSGNARGVAGDSGWRDCYANCVAMTRSGDVLLFVAKGRGGKVLTAAKLTLPEDSRPLGHGRSGRAGRQLETQATQHSGLPIGSVCGSVSGVCTEHSSLTYETPSQYVIVSITYFFFNGNLQDIDVDETRISKNKIK